MIAAPLLPPPARGRVGERGLNLYRETRGQGPDLVLLHGWGMNAAVWRGLPADLALGHRLTAIELPGHGGSPFDPAWPGLADWADACLAAAPDRAVWLGWSLGGLVALAAARRAPERLAGLVLMTATPRFVQASDWPAAMAPATLARFHDGLLADPAGTLERFLALQVRGSEAARDTLRLLKRELAERPAPDPVALALGLDLLRDSDLRPLLRILTAPASGCSVRAILWSPPPWPRLSSPGCPRPGSRSSRGPPTPPFSPTRRRPPPPYCPFSGNWRPDGRASRLGTEEPPG
jgi:pimeloyl-[acyl-carrier protein] methyl ester esterase